MAMLDTRCCQWQQDLKIVRYYYPALPFLSSWIFISCCAPHSSTLDSCSNAG
jgi:hypothetical protein